MKNPEWRPTLGPSKLSIKVQGTQDDPWYWEGTHGFYTNTRCQTYRAVLLATLLPHAIKKWTARSHVSVMVSGIRPNSMTFMAYDNPPETLSEAVEILEAT